MEDTIRLLVVDDEEQFLKTISKLLKRRGFTITAVSTGEQALEVARKEEFHVALVDLKMPGMDGEQLLEALKKEHQCIEVIILTGHGSIDSGIRTTKLGVHSYLEKPCELDTLLYVLKGVRRRHIKKNVC